MELMKERVTKTLLGMKKVINREYRVGNDMVHVNECYFLGIRYRFVSNTRPFIFLDALRGFGNNSNIINENNSNSDISIKG